MRYDLLLALALGLILTTSTGFAARKTLNLERIQVEDGDTLILTIDGNEERVQLAHVDAPEDSDNAKLQHDIQRTGLDREILIELGRAASSHLRGLTADGAGPFVLVYDPENRDRYGRLLVGLTDAAGQSMGTAMVEDGFARVLSPRGSADPALAELTELEATAISTELGLWGAHRDAALAWKGETPK